MKLNSKNLFVSAIILILTVLACANPPKTEKSTNKPAVNIPELVGKSPHEVEKTLGSPIEVVDIPDGPDSPGEYRDYRVFDNRYKLTIRFFRGKPARFICVFNPILKNLNESELAGLFGFDVSDKSGNKSMDGITFWRGSFGGVAFSDVRLTKTTSEAGFGEFRATPAE